ncbi:MAG: hypothetical protein V4527_14975 [Pseudomonadota bacterium]
MNSDKNLKTVKPARIGDGVASAVFGTIALIIGAIIAVAGGLGGAPAAGFFNDLGVLLIGVAFVIGLLKKIELRLIDVQQAIVDATTDPGRK